MIRLEDKNFKVDSTGWHQRANSQGIIYLQSPIRGITEFVAGINKKLIGEQLFDWNVAMYETQKAGKRMPTNEEWTLINKEIDPFKLMNLLAGYRNIVGVFYDCGAGMAFWSSTESGPDYANAWYRALKSSNARSYLNYFCKDNGFSVRCRKD